MGSNRYKFVAALVAAAVAFVVTADSSALAAARKGKKKPSSPFVQVNEADVFAVRVKLQVGKKTKDQNVSCLDRTPGVLATKKGKTSFASYSKLAKSLKKKNGSRAKISQYKQLDKLGKTACAKPDFLSLEPYKGAFGVKQARVLYNRFAFGGSPSEVQEAVGIGLDRAVQRLTSYVPEPELSAAEADFQCVGHRYTDSNGVAQTDADCNPANPNSIYFDGMRYGLLRTMHLTRNPFTYKLFHFLHDERATASIAAARYAYETSARDYLEMLRRAAISGDYRQLLTEVNNSTLVNFLYLNGEDNTGSGPNENFAREWWELFSIGPTSIDGLIRGEITPQTANYTDQDIAQAALAFSGAAEYCEEKTYPDGPDDNVNPDEHWQCGVDYFLRAPGHAIGPKTVFQGTAFQRTVEDHEDLLTVALEDVRTSESLALDIWNEFICRDNVTPSAVRELAKKIRDNNYNLIPVMRDVMSSRAVYAARNQNCLIKHPTELLVGFLRSSGIPIRGSRPYASMNSWLDDMGQVVLSPPTVFGWNEKKLAGESFALEWRNTVLSLINSDARITRPDGQRVNEGLFFRQTYLPGAASADDLIARVSGILGIDLNPAQIESLRYYLRTEYYVCSGADRSRCLGNSELYSDVGFDPSPSILANEAKVRGLFGVLAMLPEYRMK